MGFLTFGGYTLVVVALRLAIEALVELSDSTGDKFVRDTFDAPRERNKDLTKRAVNTSLFLEGTFVITAVILSCTNTST